MAPKERPRSLQEALSGGGNSNPASRPLFPGSRPGGRSIVYLRYRDHVLYSRMDPAALSPQIREAVGWLIYEAPDYLVISWDRHAGPPSLRGGDPKASGLVLLRSDILELRRLNSG
jgi:hypothetical protein